VDAALGSIRDQYTNSPTGSSGSGDPRVTRHQTMDRRNRSQAERRAQRHQKYRDYSLPRRVLFQCAPTAPRSRGSTPYRAIFARDQVRGELSAAKAARLLAPLEGGGGVPKVLRARLTAWAPGSRFAQAPCAAGYTLPRDFCAGSSAGRTERSEGRAASGPPGGGRGGAKGPARTPYRLGAGIKVRAGTLRRRLFPMDRSQSCGSGLPGAAPPSPQPVSDPLERASAALPC
jgi:hypothetical protein